MDKVVIDFGNFIKERRVEKGMSQAEVAKRLNISQVAYGRYERGARDAGLNMILRIAEVLEFNPGDFFDAYHR